MKEREGERESEETRRKDKEREVVKNKEETEY